MERTTSTDRRGAEALVCMLERMLAELADAAGDGDVAWLRPLAVLSAEIEYSAVRRPEVDWINLADACGELSRLLAASAGEGSEFASRYAVAHLTSPAIAALHERVLAACHSVARMTVS